MLKQLTSTEECAGKTIKTSQLTHYGNNGLYVVFTDDTFITFKAESAGGGSVEYITEGDVIDGDNIDYEVCINLGIITEAEGKALEKAALDAWEAAQRERDESEFERLRVKLGK